MALRSLYRAFAEELTPAFVAGVSGGERARRAKLVYLQRPATFRNQVWEGDHKKPPIVVLPPPRQGRHPVGDDVPRRRHPADHRLGDRADPARRNIDRAHTVPPQFAPYLRELLGPPHANRTRLWLIDASRTTAGSVIIAMRGEADVQVTVSGPQDLDRLRPRPPSTAIASAVGDPIPDDLPADNFLTS